MSDLATEADDFVTDLESQIMDLKAENKRLREALQSLVDECQSWDDAVSKIIGANPRGDWLKPYRKALAGGGGE